MNSPNDDAPYPPIRYLTASDLYNLNHEVTEGHTFVRDMHLLQYAVRRPTMVLFGEVQFSTLVDKAAALLHSVAYHHLFADGNKRTAVRAVQAFLKLNGYEFPWDHKTHYPFLLDIAQGKHDVPEIAAWLAAQIRPVGR